MDSATFQKIQITIANELGLEPGDVAENSSLVGLGMDSMDKVSLVVALEEALGIEIPDDEVRKFVTVRQIVKYVDQRSHTN